jgi:hypothetical protein
MMKAATKKKPVIGLERCPYTGGQIPNQEGVYLAKGLWGTVSAMPVDVYKHPTKGLCCFSEDFGSAGTGVDDATDCHVSVQFTGLEFITRVGDLK